MADEMKKGKLFLDGEFVGEFTGGSVTVGATRTVPLKSPTHSEEGEHQGRHAFITDGPFPEHENRPSCWCKPKMMWEDQATFMQQWRHNFPQSGEYDA